MIVTCVHIWVKPEYIDDFIKATVINHQHSIAEPGNLRFDVLQAADDSSRFLLYEAYESTEAAKEHKLTPHYLTWRDAVAPWMARPREGAPYGVIRPADRHLW